MRLQVTAYSATGERLQVLTEARNISMGDSLTFDLPKGTPGSEYLEGPCGLAVEIEALAGKSFGPLSYTVWGEVSTRYFLGPRSGSLTDVTGIWKVTAPALADAKFSKMPILPELGDTVSYPSNATPYTIIANRVAEAADRGQDYGIVVVDGGGWLTPNVANGLKFNPHDTLDAFYTALRDGGSADLFWVGTTLYVLAPGTMTIDRSGVVAFPLEAFSDVPFTIDPSNLADTILALGDNGISALYPATAPGDVLSVQFSGVTDTTVLGQLARNEWDRRQEVARQVTASLALGSAPEFLPYRDYAVGSLVSIPDGAGGSEVVAIASVTLTRDLEDDFAGNVVFDQKLKSILLKLVQLGVLGVGGATTVSGSGNVLTPVVAREQLPFEAAAGSVSITPTAANTPTSVTVTLPADRFDDGPQVVATPATSVPGSEVLGVGVTGITATSFTLWLTRTNTVATGVQWMAMSRG